MSRLISIHETAEAEINEAADFYDFEDPGLGNIFIDEVERAIEIIARFPEAATLVRGRVRKKLLVKFPYHVYADSPTSLVLSPVQRNLGALVWSSYR